MKIQFLAAVTLAAIMLFAVCTPVPEGSPETGYSIFGFVGKTSMEAAGGATVLLFDGQTDKPLSSTTANFMGKYTFSGLQPGYYKVKTGEKTMEIIITDKNQRLDIDLSAADGSMNYAAGAMKDAAKGGAKSPGKPGGDPELARKFTGKWYSFSGGSTLTGGGGSESQMALCPDGSYYESYESGYYGSSSDVTFGNANQSNASGSWSVEGTIQQGPLYITKANGQQQSVKYQQYQQDKNCYYFDGRLHCYNGQCD